MRIGNGRHYENKTLPVSLVQIGQHRYIHFLLFIKHIKKKEAKRGEPDNKGHPPSRYTIVCFVKRKEGGEY